MCFIHWLYIFRTSELLCEFLSRRCLCLSLVAVFVHGKFFFRICNCLMLLNVIHAYKFCPLCICLDHKETCQIPQSSRYTTDILSVFFFLFFCAVLNESLISFHCAYRHNNVRPSICLPLNTYYVSWCILSFTQKSTFLA